MRTIIIITKLSITIIPLITLLPILIYYSIGFIVPTVKGSSVRSFAISDDDIDNISTRSIERYDELHQLVQLHKQVRDLWPNKKRLQNEFIDPQREKGIAGVCLFRELTDFDVGHSFMSDSLHNVYIGAFVSEQSLRYLTKTQMRKWIPSLDENNKPKLLTNEFRINTMISIWY